MKYRWRASGLTILAGLILALGGCSQSPLAPDNPVLNGGSGGTFTSPQILVAAPDGSVSYVPASVEGTVGGTSNRSGTLTRSVSSSLKIDGSKGGTVRAGRLSVMLPAGAFSGFATVTVSIPDTTVMQCDLSISPLSANSFKYPARLTVDCSGLAVDVSTLTTYWYDPVHAVWVSLVAYSTTSGTALSTSLNHFSKYAAGKAGW